MTCEPTVFIVDDDEPVRISLSRLIEAAGWQAQAFADALMFLEAYDPAQPGCLLLDVRMPGMDGLDTQEELTRRGVTIPVIIITGHGDVDQAVRAMKRGALDFIKKPFNDQILMDQIHRALQLDAQTRQRQARHHEAAEQLRRLTPRERQVMDLLVEGLTSKKIGARLGISPKTVEIHRARVMMKLQADSVAQVVRLALAFESPLTAANLRAAAGGDRPS